MRRRRVVIAHGWNDAPSNGWINWLATELRARGFEVVAPEFPHRHVPRLKSWVETLGEAAGRLDGNTVLVGYSLGSPTTLRFLNDYPGRVKIAGLVLVAGFGDGIRERPGALFRPALDFDLIRKRARRRVCIYSDNDWLIAPERSKDLARRIGAGEVVVLGAGHFVALKQLPRVTDRLPAALEAVLSCYRPTWRERLARMRLWLRRRRSR